MRLVAMTALGVALAASPRVAHAACETGLSTCIDADTFWPHAGPAYFNVVGSAATTASGAVGFGWSTTYLARPLVLLLPSSRPSGTEVAAVDHLWNATFLFSYGLTERIEATLAIPTTLYRTGTGISALTQQASQPIARSAMRDIRAGAAFAVLRPPLPSAGGFSMATRLEFALPTGDESSFSGDRTVVGIPSFAGEFRRSGLVLGAEIGARLRTTSDLAGTRVGSQLVASFGMGGELLSGNKLGVMLEGVILPTLAAQHELAPVSTNGRAVAGDRRPLMPTEWLASIRTGELLSGDMSASLGAGGSLGLTGESGVTSPSFRVVFAVRYAPRAREQRDNPN
jgi:OmpA-OmpF porin, OOP family